MARICRNCGCTEDQTMDDAKTLDFQRELLEGIYSCCQIVTWADEQWLAWMEAAAEDKAAPEKNGSTEVRISVRNAHEGSLGSLDDLWYRRLE